MAENISSDIVTITVFNRLAIFEFILNVEEIGMFQYLFWKNISKTFNIL